jgi:hypothetical protein
MTYLIYRTGSASEKGIRNWGHHGSLITAGYVTKVKILVTNIVLSHASSMVSLQPVVDIEERLYSPSADVCVLTR